LRLFGSSDRNIPVLLHGISDDSWEETEVKGKFPPYGYGFIDSVEVSGLKYYDFDVTSALTNHKDNLISFKLKTLFMSNDLVSFNSREVPGFYPQLVLETNGEQTGSILVDGICIPQDTLYISEGDTASIEYYISPSILTGESLSWAVSNDNVTLTDNPGEVIAMKTGNTVLTASSADGQISQECIIHISNPVGINTMKKVPFTIFPNPVNSGNFTIELHEADNYPSQVIITDIMGRRVWSESFDPDSNKITISSNKVQPGIYVVCLRTKKSLISKRIVIN